MATTIPTDQASPLRVERERLGITRAQLANLAGCSLSSLHGIEQGAVPRKSAVLKRCWAALAAAESESGE